MRPRVEWQPTVFILLLNTVGISGEQRFHDSPLVERQLSARSLRLGSIGMGGKQHVRNHLSVRIACSLVERQATVLVLHLCTVGIVEEQHLHHRLRRVVGGTVQWQRSLLRFDPGAVRISGEQHHHYIFRWVTLFDGIVKRSDRSSVVMKTPLGEVGIGVQQCLHHCLRRFVLESKVERVVRFPRKIVEIVVGGHCGGFGNE
mmetsp:Transcript_50660/g.131741  ORF Transcript_50660/g.131741 Transcript_50660/m.131741 type:complete len:202 (+) Transcript_50660:758-1363(+)